MPVICLTMMCGTNTARSTGLERVRMKEGTTETCGEVGYDITAVLLKIQAFWHVTPRHRSSSSRHSERTAVPSSSRCQSSLLGWSDPEDEGVTILAVVGNTNPPKWHHSQEELSSTSGKTIWQMWPIANLAYP
jgi:hypothetical protein